MASTSIRCRDGEDAAVVQQAAAARVRLDVPLSTSRHSPTSPSSAQMDTPRTKGIDRCLWAVGSVEGDLTAFGASAHRRRANSC